MNFLKKSEIILEKTTKNYEVYIQERKIDGKIYYMPHVNVINFNRKSFKEMQSVFITIEKVLVGAGITKLTTLVKEDDDTHFHFLYSFGNWEHLGQLTYVDGAIYNVMELKLNE